MRYPLPYLQTHNPGNLGGFCYHPLHRSGTRSPRLETFAQPERTSLGDLDADKNHTKLGKSPAEQTQIERMYCLPQWLGDMYCSLRE